MAKVRQMQRAVKETVAKTRSAIGKLSRRKGKRYEQHVASGYRAIFGEQVKRGWQSREGHDAPDIENVPGWWVEAKHHKKVRVRAAFEQADAARLKAKSALLPVVHTADNNKDPLVTLREGDWWDLVKAKRLAHEAIAALEQHLREVNVELDLARHGALPSNIERREAAVEKQLAINKLVLQNTQGTSGPAPTVEVFRPAQPPSKVPA